MTEFYQFITQTTFGPYALFACSAGLAYIAAYLIPFFVLRIVFLMFTQLGLLLGFIFHKISSGAFNMGDGIWYFVISLFSSFLVFAVFSFMRYGIIPSLPVLWVRRYGFFTKGTVFKIEDTGMTFGSGSGSTEFQADLGAELSRQGIKVVHVKYNTQLGGQDFEGQTSMLSSDLREIPEGTQVSIKVHRLFPKVVVMDQKKAS